MPLFVRLIRSKTALAFPRVVGRRIVFLSVTSIKDLQVGAYKIREPVQGWMAGKPGRRDVVLVPCVGLDLRGHRLGHGGGFYDRWLRQNPRATRIAVLFHCQLALLLPHTSKDAVIKLAATDRGILKLL